ncbi:hypothetical protein NPIL_177741 [Nephila pilipes]|uniref:Uncharacterized protein n=1 Tax=Nephila pilipes TaxID=299642 RepID=A0A8X6TQU7_NEPPI|nr:hypothetical protein NPIL_177741 [Nephila pilipes]
MSFLMFREKKAQDKLGHVPIEKGIFIGRKEPVWNGSRLGTPPRGGSICPGRARERPARVVRMSRARIQTLLVSLPGKGRGLFGRPDPG